ncbi:hypothetical protein [Parabacteroides sp. FAFU027]|uniref:hypothetical protein n=1 Tax=Parabacteroides sp. FAFU027 TaxID=2922715 RepID=UPI001FAF9F70|nr:hypothetical protein [Parabacteroides sp. FAFU027]
MSLYGWGDGEVDGGMLRNLDKVNEKHTVSASGKEPGVSFIAFHSFILGHLTFIYTRNPLYSHLLLLRLIFSGMKW